MKSNAIKKRLLMESVGVGLLLAFLGGSAYFLSMLYDDALQQSATLETQMNAITTEATTLKERYSRIKDNADLYYEIVQKSNTDGFALSRQVIRKKFDQYKALYFLSNLKLSMGPTTEMTGPKYKRNTQIMVSSDITVSFEALSDEDVYSMMHAVERDFPGTVKTTRFTLSRKNKLTDEALLTITQSGQYPLVSGQWLFTWIGIKPIETDATKNANVPDKKL